MPSTAALKVCGVAFLWLEFSLKLKYRWDHSTPNPLLQRLRLLYSFYPVFVSAISRSSIVPFVGDFFFAFRDPPFLISFVFFCQADGNAHSFFLSS